MKANKINVLYFAIIIEAVRFRLLSHKLIS